MEDAVPHGMDVAARSILCAWFQGRGALEGARDAHER